ncbi:MAG: SDR family oxidoreductase [Oscillospiraceae bacterium]|nr:SDR family oxidoreductase [Oscillospiraceae bacterium]
MMITSMKNAFNVEGLSVLITGGNSGIGKGIAEAFAQCGAKVAIMSRNEEKGQAVAEEIAKKFNAIIKYYKGDLLSRADSRKVVEAVSKDFGRIDVLVNNAGAVRWFESIESDCNDFADWYDVIDLDLNSVFIMSVFAAKQMKKQGRGKIINISSNAAEIVNTPQTTVSYSVAKAGINHMTRMLAHEWAQYNICVNTVAPGYTESNLGSAVDPVKYMKLNDEWMAKTPTRRRNKPIEIAAAVVYLASEASDQITGEILTVDGGYKLAR